MSDTYHICYLRGVFLCFKAVSRPMWIDRLSFWIWNLGSSIRCFFQSNIRMKLLWILEQRLAGWKRIYPSKRGRITGIMHWLVAIACFSFLLCLNFLILFFFFSFTCNVGVSYVGSQPTYSYPMVLKKPPMVGSRGWYTSSISFFMGEDSLQTKTNQNKCQLNIDC